MTSVSKGQTGSCFSLPCVRAMVVQLNVQYVTVKKNGGVLGEVPLSRYRDLDFCICIRICIYIYISQDTSFILSMDTYLL